jgi:hypothetical protein
MTYNFNRMMPFGRVILMAVLCLAASMSHAQSRDAHMLHAVYGAAKTPEVEQFRKSIKEKKILEDIASILNGIVSIPELYRIDAKECGAANAFYSKGVDGYPASRSITLCYELITDIFQRLGRESTPKEVSGSVGIGTVLFIILHEIGHALSDSQKLPMFGKEEDASDAIATYLALHAGRGDPTISQTILSGGMWYFSTDDISSQYSRAHLADEHSLNMQRVMSIACHTYGADPARFQPLIKVVGMPRDRAVRCGKEYEQLSRSIKTTIGKHLR